ncbi:MAG: DUF2283 domain-containing protein [Candidatus Diapherotrites archaeon]|nr:DUF2283 domain-containing protein [Candidatus Diapherotrites archaeon]
MKYKYDKESDILLVSLGNEKPDFAEQKGNIIAHYSKDRRLVEIEILDAGRTTAKMRNAVLEQAANA